MGECAAGDYLPRVEEMTKEERILALKALAKKHPTAKDIGFMWKNPLNAKSIGIRWTPGDIAIFRKFQAQYK